MWNVAIRILISSPTKVLFLDCNVQLVILKRILMRFTTWKTLTRLRTDVCFWHGLATKRSFRPGLIFSNGNIFFQNCTGFGSNCAHISLKIRLEFFNFFQNFLSNQLLKYKTVKHKVPQSLQNTCRSKRAKKLTKLAEHIKM